MKHRTLSLFLLLICSATLTDTVGQTVFPGAIVPNSSTVEFELRYDFSVPGDTPLVKFVVIIPRTIADRQRIYDVEYSPKPDRRFRKRQNRYAEFIIERPKKRFNVRIKGKAKLFRYDLAAAQRKFKKDLAKGLHFEDFLKHEKYIEKDDPLIQQIAKGVSGQTETAVVKNIYDYVLDNMEYGGLSDTDLGAVKAAQQKKGDCSEYSDLFVALCRAKGIPARVVSGFGIRFDDVSPKHSWTEVYLKKYGWVPFDPTIGDVGHRPAQDWAFSTLRPIYVRLTHARNDDVLGKHWYYMVRWWGDRVEVEESIKFKQLETPQRTRP